MKENKILSDYLKIAKSVYNTSDAKKSEFARRLEWAVLSSEECYQDELDRFNHINSLVSSLLVASSFLTAAIVEFVIQKSSQPMGKSLIVFLIIAGSLMFASILCQLFLLLYRRRIRGKSVYDITVTFLEDDPTLFANPYSENYGRLLTLDTFFNSVKRINNVSSKIEIGAVISLALSLISFFICFFVK